MSLASGFLSALDPEATWNTTRCVCGYTVRVPSALGGWEGTCPRCFRSFVTSGHRADCTSAGRVFRTHHPERELKRVVFEPSFAERDSTYATAQRQAFIPGFLYLAATIGVCQVLVDHLPAVMATLNMAASPRWLFPAWLLSLWLLVATCTATAAVAFQWIAGNSYAQTPVFAAAGGYDIARWVPLLCYILLYGAYVITFDAGRADSLAAVRDPWLFLVIGAGVGHLATWLVSCWVFRARFSKSLY